MTEATAQKPWVVMCRVSGGVTGLRQAALKTGGVVVRFGTKQEADAEAARLRQLMSGPPRTARFDYWAERK